MDGTGDHHVKQNKLDGERQIRHDFTYRQNLDFKKLMVRVENGDSLGVGTSWGAKKEGEVG
jgi:hypothetical protein